MISKRQRRIEAQRLLQQPETKFEQVDLYNMRKDIIPTGMTRAFRNNRYTVMVYDESLTTAGNATRVLIQNHLNEPIKNHWAEIQRIKNEIFGPEVTAIEYYPAESQLINQHNIYWIWIFSAGVLPMPVL